MIAATTRVIPYGFANPDDFANPNCFANPIARSFAIAMINVPALCFPKPITSFDVIAARKSVIAKINVSASNFPKVVKVAGFGVSAAFLEEIAMINEFQYEFPQAGRRFWRERHRKKA